ncbi:Hypothetical protein ORPV_1131 [Orpheovirus IHUMI-LCC2]|uniref:Uncharacterized protein n=1 Tax=Orpheovirus IHUMI-LCC2 TaxID=2023057 RepID=A0A2I2L657_9VIRU|nr:Hypothetical protein ORPV_1131 [Orpheovirus IHUMI-LCC2]SNW63035.1 Hypothetical protein ORPV_1131 [Orpheovirus IHUMI-LCC2]
MSCSSLYVSQDVRSIQSLTPQNLNSSIDDILRSIIPTIVNIEKDINDDIFINDYAIYANIENNMIHLYFHICSKIDYDDDTIINLLKDSGLNLKNASNIKNYFKIDIDNIEDAKKVLVKRLIPYVYPKNTDIRRMERNNISEKLQYIKVFVTAHTTIHITKLDEKYRIDNMKADKAEEILDECLKVEKETVGRIEEYLSDNFLVNLQIDINGSIISFNSIGYYKDVHLYIPIISMINIPLSIFDDIQTHINYNITYMRSSSKDDIKDPIMLHDDEYFIMQDIAENVNVIVLEEDDLPLSSVNKDYKLSELD